MRYRSLLTLTIAALLLSACSGGYHYNPREVDCRTPEGQRLCAPSFQI